MKKIEYMAIIAVAILSAGCAKEIDSPELGEGTELTITASFAEEQTRTTLQDGGTAVYWEPGDEINLFLDGESGRFESTISELSEISKFKGILPAVIGGGEGYFGDNNLMGLYPYRADAISDGASITTALPSEQAGRAGSFAKNTNITVASSNTTSLAFYNVCGGLRFSLTQSGVKEIVFKGQNGETVAGQVKIAFEDDVPVVKEVVEGIDSIILTAPAGETFEVGKWYYIVALPGTLSAGFKLTFNTETQYATLKSSKSVVIKRGIFGSLADADAGLAFKNKNVPEAVEAVDLGLSVMWASCNVGAENPEDYGDYFAWGETEGFESGKTNFDWATYKWCNGTSMNLTKYCTDHCYGSVDNKTMLESSDDAAAANWGSNWRMATHEEMQELVNCCTWTWTTLNGINGYMVVSNKSGYTDKSIFLPATGYRDSALETLGVGGAYCSKSLNYNDRDRVWEMNFNNADGANSITSDWSGSRCCGFSIRPVCPAKVTAVSLSAETLEITRTFSKSLTVAVLPESASGSAIIWTSSDESIAKVVGGKVSGVSVGTATVTACSIDGGASATCVVTVKELTPEYVDLGLSVKWATCNVGAENPEDFGDYFAWGETVGIKGGKTYFDWNTYKWCKGTKYTMTKYCVDSSHGTVDNKKVLEPEDDAASVNWGGNWRMPTVTEMRELLNSCTITTEKVNGVSCLKFVSKLNGRYIFLPAAGDYYRNIYQNASVGLYWTSSLYTSNSCEEYSMVFSVGGSTSMKGSFRFWGRSVRPVTE